MLPRDVADIAGDVLAHRLVLSFDAVAEGVDPRTVIRSLEVVPQPGGAADETAWPGGMSAERTEPHGDQPSDADRRTHGHRRGDRRSASARRIRPSGPVRNARFRGLDLTVRAGSTACCTASTPGSASGRAATPRS